MRIVKAPSEITFHWSCERPNCSYESGEMKFDKENPNPTPPKCPKCDDGIAQVLHQGDIVEEIDTGRLGKVWEARQLMTDSLRWRVEFSDGQKPIMNYFITRSDLRLIDCPHSAPPESGPKLTRGSME